MCTEKAYARPRTRMHSSRMRTARSSGRPGGVSTRHNPPGADPIPGTRHHQDQTPLGAGTPPLPPYQDQAPPPPPGPDPPALLTESQTPVKTLPCPNFVTGGNETFPLHPQYNMLLSSQVTVKMENCNYLYLHFSNVVLTEPSKLYSKGKNHHGNQ